MKTATTVFQLLVRITGLIQIVLGALIWIGIGASLISVHIVSGSVLVLALWALAVVAARAGVERGLVVAAVAWGLILPVLGLTQQRLVPGPSHWLIQALHLLLGLGALGLAENLARRTRRAIERNVERAQIPAL